MRRVVIATGLSLLVAIPAFAIEGPRVQQAQAQAPAHNPLDCRCRAQGRTFEIGEKVCLRTAEGPQLARCEMVLNVTSWALTRTPCLDS